jgi:hypothetical protein
MIDWKQARPADFDCSFEGEDISETGTHIQIPVRVLHRESGETAFTQAIPIRADFYRELKKQPDHLQALVKIVNRRCRDMLLQKIAKDAMEIADKVNLIEMDSRSIE